MENKAYPKIKNAILLCLFLLGIQVGAALVFGIFLRLFGLGNESMIDGVGTSFIYLLTFGLVILIGYKKTGKKINEVFMFNNIPLNLWIAVIVFMFGYVILSSELDNLIIYILPMPEFFQELFNSMLANEYIIISIVLVGILPAFAEEMLFRGVILSGFKENYSQKKAIIISSLLFGLVHLNPWQFVTAFISGMIIAWICLQTKSILPCIYIHLFNNLLSVLVMNYGDMIPINGFTVAYYDPAFKPLWVDAIGIVLTGIGVLLFFIGIKKPNTAHIEAE